MLARASLFVLAEAAEIGLPEAAHVPARAFDPLLRPFIKKRVRNAVTNASARTNVTAGDHILKLAFVGAHPDAPSTMDPNDRRAVDEAYTSLAAPFLPPAPKKDSTTAGAYRVAASDRQEPFATPTKRKKRFWPVTIPLTFAFLAAAIGVAGVLLFPFVFPTRETRFRRTPFGVALGEPLADYVAHAARDGDPETKGKLLAPMIERQVGAPAFDALTKLTAAIPNASTANVDSIDAAMAPLFDATNALNAALVDKKIPALVHAYGSGRRGHRAVWVTSYYVDERSELSIEGKSVRIARGRRIDSLNLDDSPLYKAHGENWAILSTDYVEQEFVETLLSPIARGLPLGPNEFTESDTSALAELARKASRLVSDEVVRAAHISQSDADGLRRAIADRNEAAVSLAKHNYPLEPSSRMEFSPNMVKGLKMAQDRHPNDRALLAEILRMNERIAMYRPYVAPAVAVLAEIEEDVFAARLLEEKRLENVKAERLADLADDLTAKGYFAAELDILMTARKCPKLTLWTLAKPVVSRGGFSGNAALDDEISRVLLSALFHDLGLVKNGDPDSILGGEAFAQALAQALELPDDRIRTSAGKVYQAFFGLPAAPLVRTTLR